MTPIRYTTLLLFLCLFAGARSVHAQCTASTVATNVYCAGGSNGSIDLTVSGGTGPYVFAWSNGQSTEDLTGIPAGVYTYTVTDALACSTTGSETVSEPAQILIDLGPDMVLNCLNPAVFVVANVTGGTPPYLYQWSNGSQIPTIQVVVPGAYTLQVTDAFGCTALSTVLVLLDTPPPVACVANPEALNCMNFQTTLDASCSSTGPNFAYNWVSQSGNIVSGVNTINPIVDQPGLYILIITDAVNGCTAQTSVTVTQNITQPTINAGPDLNIPCGSGIITLGGSGSQGANFVYAWTGPGIVAGETTLNPSVVQPGTYTLIVTNTVNGCTATDEMTVSASGTGLCSSIAGRVVQDTIVNCTSDAGEPPLAGWVVKAEGASSYYGVTDANGEYEIFVEAGDTYSVSSVAPGALWQACPPVATVTVSNPGETLTADDLLFQKLAGCPMLFVNIGSGNLRRCFANNLFSVSYCNNGTEAATDAYVVVTLEPLFTPLGSSLPYTDLGNGMIRFEVGNLAIGQCGSFNFYAQLSCDAVLGQTHCTEAHIYPDTTCLPPDVQWSGASLSINSACEPDSVHFRIENVGTGNMVDPLEYIVIEDQVMLMNALTEPLDVGEFAIVSVPANGSTWRLEVSQEPFYPGQPLLSVSVEGCTTGGTFSTGFVTQFPIYDGDDYVDIDCRQNTGSYDPNDKQGFPTGYGAEHYIRPGTPLEYQIRFQNTGNDTAFTVRIVDTLSAWLDPATIRPGASSHPYSWDLSGAGVLTFLFENILLPDSNVNEAASHGFVKFGIDPRADAPLETVIENTAGIYFDFNDAVITNTTFHRLGENFIFVGQWQPQQAGYEVLVSPNPFFEGARLEVRGLRENTPLHLQVFDLQGKLRVEMDSDNAVFQLKSSNLSEGMYLFKIEQAGKNVGTGKMVVQGR